MDKRYRPPRRIDRMGVELEGAWRITRLVEELQDRNWHSDGTVDVRTSYSAEEGEIVSPPLAELSKLQDWVKEYYPDAQNETCGTHVHVSVLDTHDRRRLSTEEFYDEFLERAAAWAKAQPMTSDVRKAWDKRYRGENQYCCRNFQPCDKPHHADCEHDCGDYEDASCREHECEHECESDDNMFDARSGHRPSCLQHECAHDHDEECCSIDHEHGEDEDDKCDSGDCQHECDSMDCFDLGDCQHECDQYCYSDCQHDCEDDEEECHRDSHYAEYRHHPAAQRGEDWDDCDSRYAHLNFGAEGVHGTLEIRLAPAFCDAEITAAWVGFVHDLIEEWLSGEAPGDKIRQLPANSCKRNKATHPEYSQGSRVCWVADAEVESYRAAGWTVSCPRPSHPDAIQTITLVA